MVGILVNKCTCYFVKIKIQQNCKTEAKLQSSLARVPQAAGATYPGVPPPSTAAWASAPCPRLVAQRSPRHPRGVTLEEEASLAVQARALGLARRVVWSCGGGWGLCCGACSGCQGSDLTEVSVVRSALPLGSSSSQLGCAAQRTCTQLACSVAARAACTSQAGGAGVGGHRCGPWWLRCVCTPRGQQTRPWWVSWRVLLPGCGLTRGRLTPGAGPLGAVSGFSGCLTCSRHDALCPPCCDVARGRLTRIQTDGAARAQAASLRV